MHLLHVDGVLVPGVEKLAADVTTDALFAVHLRAVRFQAGLLQKIPLALFALEPGLQVVPVTLPVRLQVEDCVERLEAVPAFVGTINGVLLSMVSLQFLTAPEDFMTYITRLLF